MTIQKLPSDFVTYKNTVYMDFSKKGKNKKSKSSNNKNNSNGNKPSSKFSYMYPGYSIQDAESAALAAGYTYAEEGSNDFNKLVSKISNFPSKPSTPKDLKKWNAAIEQVKKQNAAYEQFVDDYVTKQQSQHNTYNEALAASNQANAAKSKNEKLKFDLEAKNLELEMMKANVKGQKEVKNLTYGGKANKLSANAIDVLSKSKAAERNGLEPINLEDFKGGYRQVEKTAMTSSGAPKVDPLGNEVKYLDEEWVGPKQSAVGYAFKNRKALGRTLVDELTGYTGETKKSRKIHDKISALKTSMGSADSHSESWLKNVEAAKQKQASHKTAINDYISGKSGTIYDLGDKKLSKGGQSYYSQETLGNIASGKVTSQYIKDQKQKYLDSYDKRIKEATASGNTAKVKALEAEKSDISNFRSQMKEDKEYQKLLAERQLVKSSAKRDDSKLKSLGIDSKLSDEELKKLANSNKIVSDAKKVTDTDKIESDKKTLNKIEDLGAKEQEEIRSGRAQALIQKGRDVANAGSVGLDTISSKHRAQTVREKGLTGLKQKQAKLAYALGDRSFGTKFFAGKLAGPKIFGGFNPFNLATNLKVHSNQKSYAKSLRYGGSFSENDKNNLSAILAMDFSVPEDNQEEQNTSGTIPMRWQPEEYAKLKILLDADFEAIDDAVLKEQNDFSVDDTKLRSLLEIDFSSNDETETSTEDSTSTGEDGTAENLEGEQVDEEDLSIDYSNLDKESVVNLLNTSFYTVKDKEKKLQETIAKGFSAEEDNSYNDFLEEASFISDSFNGVYR